MRSMILFGFKGSGKTYWGQRLSRQLSCPFIDTDRCIESAYHLRTGQLLSCREIYLILGNEGFRALETRVLEELTESGIIALGGGTILNEGNQARLSQMGFFVYLELTRSLVKERMLQEPLPAYLDPGDLDGSFAAMYEQRETAYRQIPAIRVEISHQNEEEILKALCTIFLENNRKASIRQVNI